MAKQVIKFYADWCGPCKQYGPTFEKVKQELQSEQIEFTEINVENDPDGLTKHYEVKGIPHTVLLEDGKVKRVQPGNMPEQQLREFILY